MKYIQIITTCPNKKTCKKIIEKLLEDKLAACCQIIGPVESHYWWQEKIERGIEWLIIIKSRKKDYKKIEKKIKELHPYQVPEIISLNISDLSKEYFLYLTETLYKKS